MKTVLIFVLPSLLLAVQAQPSNNGSGGSGIFSACNKEAGVTDKELQQFFASQMAPTKATEPIKCQLKCVMEKLDLYKNNMLDEDMTEKFFKQRKLDQKLGAEHMKKVIQDCSQKKGVDDCDSAYQVLTCFDSSKMPIIA